MKNQKKTTKTFSPTSTENFYDLPMNIEFSQNNLKILNSLLKTLPLHIEKHLPIFEAYINSEGEGDGEGEGAPHKKFKSTTISTEPHSFLINQHKLPPRYKLRKPNSLIFSKLFINSLINRSISTENSTHIYHYTKGVVYPRKLSRFLTIIERIIDENKNDPLYAQLLIEKN